MRHNRNIVALAAAILYLLLWVGLMYWIKFPVRTSVPAEQALLIDFGEELPAGGEEDTPLADDPAVEPTPPVEAPAQTPTPPVQGDVPVEQRPAEQPQRQPDQRALFPGRTASSTSASQGASEGAGNQGSAAGMADGTSYALTGRNLVGELPKPAYRSSREGRVVVEIVVDPSGRVVSATHRTMGTTGDATMIRDAEAAALRARFTPSEAGNNQQGTIVYIFKLNG